MKPLTQKTSEMAAQRGYRGEMRQSAVTAWLRNMHGIHVMVFLSNLPMGGAWEWGYAVAYIQDPLEHIDEGMYYETYEDAMEAGIMAALEMIEVVN